MTGIGIQNPNANKAGHEPFGLASDQVNYIITKLDIAGLDYISGILFVPPEHAQRVSDEINPYPQFKAKVEHWLKTGEFEIPSE